MTDAHDKTDAYDDLAVTRRPVDEEETRRATRTWWDAHADSYLDEHGDFLGPSEFVWGPEGLTEQAAQLLGDVRRRHVLEIGCGAAQCTRWLRGAGAVPVGVDLAAVMLHRGQVLGRDAGVVVPLVQADAGRMPFRDAVFDLACSAYGALPFVADAAAVQREVARVLRPGGRWVFSVSHPVRWVFPDDPGPWGLVARTSYWDRRPYVEQDAAGSATYVEHHRTIGDWVHTVAAAGLRLVDIVEPQWPAANARTWGGWSPLRGRTLPGTAIFVTVKD